MKTFSNGVGFSGSGTGSEIEAWWMAARIPSFHFRRWSCQTRREMSRHKVKKAAMPGAMSRFHFGLFGPSSHSGPGMGPLTLLASLPSNDCAAAKEGDADEQDQPHHVHEMPVPGGGFEAEMALRGELLIHGAEQADDEEACADDH